MHTMSFVPHSCMMIRVLVEKFATFSDSFKRGLHYVQFVSSHMARIFFYVLDHAPKIGKHYLGASLDLCHFFVC
jgi:hypothetical protein